MRLGIILEHYVVAGMNEAGLSCDQQTLIHTVYPNRTGNTLTDVGVDHFCERVLGQFNSTAALKKSLDEKTLTPHGPCIVGGQHFVIRDSRGDSLVVEFLDGITSVWLDRNDGGKSGYGVLTNEPPFPWHIENVRHMEWKLGNERPSFTMPGTFYPDERFLRIHLLKSNLPKPATNVEAIQQALHVLNSVTVPIGTQMGTDSSKGEGQEDHTRWGVIYDHLTKTVYWRTKSNQNLQRIRLCDAQLQQGATRGSIAFAEGKNDLPFFHDAASAFKRL